MIEHGWRCYQIFVGLYLLNFLLVAAIYAKAAPASFQPIFLALLCTSKRLHSIFMLRLFNDGAVPCSPHRECNVQLSHSPGFASAVSYAAAGWPVPLSIRTPSRRADYADTLRRRASLRPQEVVAGEALRLEPLGWQSQWLNLA